MEHLWSATLPEEMYRNPILYADYSDPDVIRVGSDYFLIASSFTYVPGIPLLHSRDLIHWKLINYCVKRLPFSHYDQPVHGSGTWAPSIRYHGGRYYVVFPMPDEGIFVTTAEDPWGDWTEPHCIAEAKGWIDPCPFWDEDGQTYLVFAYAKSRCGIKHKLSICRVDEHLQGLLSEPQLLYDGTLTNPTLEGPKMYKREGWYYIFAPAGGVEEGWQTVLRSRNPEGPYEYRIVMHQGNTSINGPHQGAWVDTPEGENWFFHFRDLDAYGRVLYLEPMIWENDWPFIGAEQNGDGIGEPVEQWILPAGALKDSDADVERNGSEEAECADCAFAGGNAQLSRNKFSVKNWQWQANPRDNWYSETANPYGLRMYAMRNEKREENLLWYAGNALTSILQAPSFVMDAKAVLSEDVGTAGDLIGLGMIGHEYSYLALQRVGGGQFVLRLYEGHVSEIQGAGKAVENLRWEMPLGANTIYLRMELKGGVFASDEIGKMSFAESKAGKEIARQGNYCYSYSTDGISYEKVPCTFPLRKATWTGAKVVLIGMNRENHLSDGYGDLSYIRFTNSKGEQEV